MINKVDWNLIKKFQTNSSSVKKTPNYYELTKKAVNNKNLEICLKFKNPQYDNCLWRIALNTRHSEYCLKLIDKAKQIECQEILTYNKAIKNQKIKACYNFQTKSIQDRCFTYFITQKWQTPDDCLQLDPDRRDTCQNKIKKKIAIQKKDASECQSLSQLAERKNCKTIIANLPIDTDGDGLSDKKERSYGFNPFNPDTDNDGLDDGAEIYKYQTNPLNPDTDNDGFTDGEEVKSGYNPNGIGKLSWFNKIFKK